MSKQTYSVCFCIKRRFRIKEAEMPLDVTELFASYSENGSMNAEHLHRFLKEVQGEEKLTKDEAQALMDSFINERKNLNFFRSKTLHIRVFQVSAWGANAPLPNPPKVHQDMKCPLSHYFIYTGHNSYLTGNQITSDSSDEPIIDALKRGVRVIELDMWPSPNKDDVDMMHGGTLTSPVKLIKCLKAIREHAFVASDYPVIITLEDHLNQELQAKVAEMVHETFQDVLVCSPSDSFQEFPSPESSKGRVLISTKPPNEYLETKLESEGIDYEDEDEAEDKDEAEDEGGVQPSAPPEYKNLIAIRAEKIKGGIKAWLRVSLQKAHRVSLNEEKLEDAVVTHGTEIVR